MPSLRSAADPLDPGPKGFAHRGLHSGVVPENSLASFAAAVEFGAGIECDLRLTADGVIVVFHDADARRMCASPMRIGQSTLQELERLRVGGEPIPTLPDLLSLTGGRVPLLLEVKVDRDIWRWLPALRRDLVGFRGPLGVTSFDPRLARLLKSNMPQVRRGLVLRERIPPLRRRLAMALAAPDFLGVERTALDRPWVQRARKRIPVYGWTIKTALERAQADVQADALIWEADGRPRI
jgi:glycerophosphoryl diester phosphodiesterase